MYPYLILLFLEIIASQLESRFGVYLLKPLLMPTLAYFYFNSSKIKDRKIDLKYIFCLFFCFLGDVFLMFDKPIFFILGLGSFLIGQLIYCLIFYKTSSLKITKAVSFLIYGLLFYLVLYSHLDGVLKIAVLVYASAISAMWALSYNQIYFNKVLFIGASLFVFSDSIIALNKFLISVPFSGVLVMSTYGLGQLLICKGLLEQKIAKK
jgi:uncharacterized membrane protein YhhN